MTQHAAATSSTSRSTAVTHAGTSLVVTGLLIGLLSAWLIAAGMAGPQHARGQGWLLAAGITGATVGGTALLIGIIAMGVRLGLADREAGQRRS